MAQSQKNLRARPGGSRTEPNEVSPALFDRVRAQVEALIPLFGVGRQASDILVAFDTLCTESLNLDVRRRAPEFSRINSDGTPFQFSLSLNSDCAAPLQFLSEPGRPGCSMEERRATGFSSLRKLARSCRVVEEVERIIPTLNHFAPERHPDLLANPSGVFWFALSFWPDSVPALTVYINGDWGSKTAQWQRLDDFAAFFNSTDRWLSVASLAPPGLSPLGMALTLRPKRAFTGRIYLRAFGEPLSVYRTLFAASAATRGAADAVEGFGRCILRDAACYPTRSAVFSIDFPAAPMAGAKIELCAHCAFAHDAQAATRISDWLQESGIDGQVYRGMVSNLTRHSPLSGTALPSLHAYVGIGARGSEHYTSVYLNPGPALEEV